MDFDITKRVLAALEAHHVRLAPASQGSRTASRRDGIDARVNRRRRGLWERSRSRSSSS